MRGWTLALVASVAMGAGVATAVVQDVCGTFTDVSPAFCPYVLEMYYLGITAGTSPTTYSPEAMVTRGQAAVFVSKGVNQAIARSSRRAALAQWWTTKRPEAIGLTPVTGPTSVASDGVDVWVSAQVPGTVTRVRASDGRVLDTWTGLPGANSILPAMGRIFVAGGDSGKIYAIDPAQPPGLPSIVVSDLPSSSYSLAFDGVRLWSANADSVSLLTPAPTYPWSIVTRTEGFTIPGEILYDGRYIWVTDQDAGLLKLDAEGAVIQSVPVGPEPGPLVFDGANLWTTLLHTDAVVVVSSVDGSIRATLTGNGLNLPNDIAFDGERVMVTSFFEGVSYWRAADLAPLGFVSTGGFGVSPLSVCSDGINFWVAFSQSNGLGRF